MQKLYTQMLLIAFLHAAATASIATVEVLYLRHTLLASYTMIGAILGTAAIGYLIFAPFLKELAKATGRGVYLTWTSFILALAAVFAANISQPAMYLVSKSIILLLAPLTFGILMQFIEDELKFNADTESCYAGLTLTAMIGGIIGFLLAGKIGVIAYSHGYILSTAAFMIAGFIALGLPTSTKQIRKPPALNPLDRLNTCFSKKYRHITYIVLATNSYWAIRDITIPLLLIENGYSVLTVGALFAIGAFFGVISSIITRILLNKNHPERVMVAALAIGAIASLLLPFGGLIVLGVLYAIYMSTEVAISPSLSDRVEETTDNATTYITSLSTASALAWTITPWIAGILLEAGVGLRGMLFIGGIIITVAYVVAKHQYLPDKYFPKLSLRKNKKTLTW